MPQLTSDGTFTGTISDIYPVLIGEKKTPGIKVHVTIAEDGEHRGQHVNGVLWFTEKAAARSMKTLVDLGLPENDFDALADLIGRDVEVVCQWDDAHEYVNVQWFNAPGAHARAGCVGLEEFKARAHVLGKAPAQVARKSDSRVDNPPTTDKDEDDLPF